MQLSEHTLQIQVLILFWHAILTNIFKALDDLPVTKVLFSLSLESFSARIGTWTVILDSQQCHTSKTGSCKEVLGFWCRPNGGVGLDLLRNSFKRKQEGEESVAIISWSCQWLQDGKWASEREEVVGTYLYTFRLCSGSTTTMIYMISCVRLKS